REGVVLITGESGTGKELVARAVHARSPRRDRPFVAFHAASVPAGLVAAELFGAVPGAFTGAKREREGAVGRASGGVLFLDEIGEIPLDVQPALLRLLESGESTALGASESRRFDLRIVAATHRDLAELVAQGLFRQDLFYRLNVFTLDIPPLRRRRSDIADLVRHFLARHGGDDLELELEPERAAAKASHVGAHARERVEIAAA
ncbi:MAG: sigma-54 factor interaction domain-containing protein, partial [Myxococcales bacterium]|nr:sigma-54 factor interaction domain-containing protein [Myxococcales bacterium]